MKKMLKFAIVLSTVITILSSNVAVIAAEMTNLTENTQIVENVENTETENETNNDNNTVNNEVENEVEENQDNNVENETTNSVTNAKEEEPANKEENLVGKEMVLNNNEIPVTPKTDEPEATVQGVLQTMSLEEGIPAKLHVTLNLKLPNPTLEARDFVVSLKKYKNTENTNETIIPLTESSGTNGKFYYEFDNIPTDPDPEKLTDYVLNITGKNYQNYSQIISAKSGKITNLEIFNSYDVNWNVSENEKIRAVMGIGSINGDKSSIGENDINKMINSIEDNKKEYDLNGDNAINIIDLSYVVLNSGKTSALAGDYWYDQIIPLDEENLKSMFEVQDKGTAIEGKLENILKNNDEYVSLTPSNPAQEISPSNPVELTINLEDNKTETQEITIAPSSNPENNIEKGEAIIVYDLNGNEETMEIPIGDNTEELEEVAQVKEVVKVAAKSISALGKINNNAKLVNENAATIESDGTIVLNLGNKVAVKKVTIRVKGTKSKKLADIAKVEFLNDMEERIPAPEIFAPTHLWGEAGYDSLVIYWDAMPNVTGYELEIKATIKGEEKVEYHQVDGNQITLNQFYTEDFKDNHYTPFDIRVQSVNGDWRSGYGETITLIPVPNGPPAAPDNLFVKGGVKEITATWKNMKSTRRYNVEYRKFGEKEWIVAAQGLETNSITIKDLEDKVKYEVRVQGVNEKGDGPFCTPGEATTLVAEPAILPRYKAINLPKKDEEGNELEGVVTEHIVNATYGRGDGRSYMVDSSLDENKPKSALGTVDNTYVSYGMMEDSIKQMMETKE